MASDNSTVTYRDIPGFPGYRAGSDGSVWSCLVHGGRWERRVASDQWKQLTPSLSRHRTEGRRYPYLNLHRGGVQSTFKVHTLILLTFVGGRPDGMECRHLDNNPLNNALSNLCWGTAQENADDRVANDRIPRGEQHRRAKLTEAGVREIRRRFASGGVSKYRLAKDFHVTHSVIRKIIDRSLWKHVE